MTKHIIQYIIYRPIRRNLTNAVLQLNQSNRLMNSSTQQWVEKFDDGQETIIPFNYIAILTNAVQAIQELSDIGKKPQEQIDTQKQQIDRLINMILNAQVLNHRKQFAGKCRKTKYDGLVIRNNFPAIAGKLVNVKPLV